MMIPANVHTSKTKALEDVFRERCWQDELKAAGKFPWTCADRYNPDTAAPIRDAEKLAVLAEEFGEVADIVCKLMANREEAKGVSQAMLKEELIQVAAVAVAWAESIIE